MKKITTFIFVLTIAVVPTQIVTAQLQINGSGSYTTVSEEQQATITSGNVAVNEKNGGMHIDLSDPTPPPSGIGWTFAGNVYTILDSATVTITGTSANQRRIEIAADASVFITLDGVTITGLNFQQTPLLLHSGAEATLNLINVNTFTGNWSAGLQVPEGTTLTIDGTGSLIARATVSGAGIGAGRTGSAGTITINGGTIIATGNGGAGIGGGTSSAGGTITINGGTVTASGGGGGAGIGGGWVATTGGTITINGGTVTAMGSGGAGIGSGQSSASSASSVITINGGIITARGGDGGAGIGGGQNGSDGGTITIQSGIVTATSSGGGAGIGGGLSRAGGTVTISGGIVITTGAYGIGRGAFSAASHGSLTLSGNTVVFANSVGDTDESRRTRGILFTDNSGILYGNSVTLTDDVTIPNGAVLLIPNGATLTIPAGITLDNNGSITNCGTINRGNGYGTWIGNEPTAGADIIDLNVANPALPCDRSWTFANNIYTIHDGATVTIIGTNINQRRIAVAAGANVNITLDDVTIEGLGTGQAPLLLNDGAKVVLTLEGTNTLVAGSDRAAIQVPNGTELTITGTGRLTARAIQQSAGIGGGRGDAGGTITIHNGTITAIGGTTGAGIGGGGSSGGGTSGGAGGIVTIYNGVVTAIGGGLWSAQGIGRGAGGWSDPDTAAIGIFAMNGNAVVFANSIDDTNKNRRINGILFVNNSGIFHGSSVAVTDDVTIPDGAALLIPEGATLTIPAGITLTNNGTITNCGIINKGGSYGTWKGNEPTVGSDVLDLSTANPVLPCDRSWTFANNIYTIHDGATVTITGTSINQRRIVVAANASVNITLENAVITGLAANQSPLSLSNGANVVLTILGTNTLAGGNERTAIEVPQGTTLTIEGSGSLTASGGREAAGIGSNRWNSSGTIIINGGIITATGGSGGAGIGGGEFGSGGMIVIDGGVITARGSGGGAGIGDGAMATGSNITINGGVVNASGGSSAAGIGGGEWGPSGNGIITINGGHVTATGGGWGAGIGTGSESRANFAITISGGFVEARGGVLGDGIGKGRNAENVGTFTLNGNAVIIASSIGDTDISRRTSGILLGTHIDDWGTFYGSSVTLTDDVTTRFRTLLRIPRHATLTIPKGITFTNNGTIINCGTINRGGSHGTWVSNEPVLGSDNNTIDLNIVNPAPPCDGSWMFANDVYTIFDGANITITGTSINQRVIVVAANANVNITLEDAKISVAELSWESPFLLRNNANLTLTLVGTNTLIAGYGGDGLQVWEGTTLTIIGTGGLTATGGYGGTGIGHSWLGGNIIINDGVITAIGGSGAQGIGNSEEGGMPSTLTLNGNAIVFTNSVSDTDQRRRTSGILVIGNTTHWYGSPEFTLSGDVTIPSTHTLTIDAGKTLTIPIGTTLTNNGTVRNCGTINKGGNFGVWIGNNPTPCTESTINIYNEEQSVVKIYSNPVTDLLHIVIPNEVRDLPATVELFDMNGRRVFSQPIIHLQCSICNLQITVDMTPFPQGVYILRIGNHVARVVK